MKFIFFLFLSFLSVLIFGQDEKWIRQIDSLNHDVPYEKRIDHSTINLNKYKRNADLAESISYAKGLADSYSNISLIYYYRSNYEISADYFFKAIKLYEQENLMAEAGNLYGIYGYRLRNKDIQKSIAYMQKGIRLAKQANKTDFLKSLYDNYGLVKEVNGEKDSAYYYFNKSLQLKTKDNDRSGIPYSLNKIATLFLSIGKSGEAKKYFDEAYQIRIQINDPIGIAENLNFYGLFYETTGNIPQAISYYNQGLEASKKAGYRYLAYKSYESLAQIHETIGKYDDALNFHKQFVAYKDSLYNVEVLTHQRALEIQYETEKKEKELLENRAELAENKLEIKQKNLYVFVLGFLLILIGLISWMIYRFQKQKNIQLQKDNELKDALIKIESQNKVHEERMRISRDLHDNIGSQLTFVISSLDNLNYQIDAQNEVALEKLGYLNQFTRKTISELRDTIWAMNRENISSSDLEIRLNNFLDQARNSLERIDFNITFNSPSQTNQTYTSFQGINLFRVIQEAVNNAIKHANATEISILFSADENKTIVEIRDNGTGISSNEIESGNGIRNMQKRIQDIGGFWEISALKPKGTLLKFTF